MLQVCYLVTTFYLKLLVMRMLLQSFSDYKKKPLDLGQAALIVLGCSADRPGRVR
ncbi:hypothetical protein SAMN06269250_2707 [Spirosoma fluviale]|uniref:Uncharacterized protein n=1 Tax=Spirosoma fluviale TaxID=1597977 RepID=A0A286FZ88_9BACT|nr:hypothetical protein SAMN06269250_2707 [Spirosoma fluviale]